MESFSKIIDKTITDMKNVGQYRYFTSLERIADEFPMMYYSSGNKETKIVNWCTNDYLGMSVSSIVIEAIISAASLYGAGSGGSRNISGNSKFHLALEDELASLHNKESALVFNSGYNTNVGALNAIQKTVGNVFFFSDALNHASIIQGIKLSNKFIFNHNDIGHLESLLKGVPKDALKVIVFESIYSMQGDVAPIEAIINIAKKYNALTYIDEAHAVGIYGKEGEGLAGKLGLSGDIDIIQGTLSKAYGVIGGYIASRKNFIDLIRCTASSFIFTTSLPIIDIIASTASIQYLRNNRDLIYKLEQNSDLCREEFNKRNINILSTESHILPVVIGDAHKAKEISDSLLKKWAIYTQPINYPTVPVGTERFRITPTPFHTNNQIVNLADALQAELILNN
jgi:5-aminolevulinate synthase